MAETVEQELQRNLIGATTALKEVEAYITKYTLEKEILENRVKDLKIALRAFEKVSPAIAPPEWDNLQIN